MPEINAAELLERVQGLTKRVASTNALLSRELAKGMDEYVEARDREMAAFKAEIKILMSAVENVMPDMFPDQQETVRLALSQMHVVAKDR